MQLCSHVLVFASNMIRDRPFMTSTQTGGGKVHPKVYACGQGEGEGSKP